VVDMEQETLELIDLLDTETVLETGMEKERPP
jgi:hypothetical protein